MIATLKIKLLDLKGKPQKRQFPKMNLQVLQMKMALEEKNQHLKK